MLKTPKRQENCRNSASFPYWRSLEDPDRVLFEACGSTYTEVYQVQESMLF